MSDPRRRLRLVTEAAYHAQPDVAGPRSSEVAEGDSAGQHVGGQRPEGPAASSTVVRLRHRWSTPPMVAVRVGLVVLVLAVVVAVTILVMRPSAPAQEHPDLAWPSPPPDWDPDNADGATGAEGAGDAEASDRGAAQDPGTGAGPSPASGGTDEPSGADSAQEGPEQVPVVVHVAGEVHQPGIVELPPGARVHEAITAAGGPTEAAALDVVNLAAPLTDGTHLLIPAVGEEPAAPVDPDPGTGPAGEGEHSGGELVDLNAADATTLQTLPGIGPAMAERIIDHRTTEGPFTSVDQLSAVSGVGPATMERLRDLVTV